MPRAAPKDVAGQGCVIGGVTVPDFDLGTEAHSDGDVLYHRYRTLLCALFAVARGRAYRLPFR